MAHFHRERIAAESVNRRLEPLRVLRRVLEAPWILQQYCSQTAGLGHGIEVVSKRFDVSRAGELWFMREAAEHLRGELEIGIARGAADPALRVRRRRDPIERRVDLDRVEKRNEVRQRVEPGAV